MKCPFRAITKYEYVDLGEGNIALDTQLEDFPDCYENDCPLWQYNYETLSYSCLRTNELGVQASVD